jgi:hypothetical protein
MRDGIIIGMFYAALGSLMTALAAKYAGPLFWDLVQWGSIALIFGCLASLALSFSHQSTGRPFLGPALCINLAICLATAGLLWHFYKSPPVSGEYLYFDVDIAAGANSAGFFPGRIVNVAPSTFFNVDSWFSLEAGKGKADPQDGTNPYWSLRPLKVFMPILHSGGPRTGKFLPMGYYFVQCNATYKDISYYFRELLEIREYQGAVIQLIDVWKNGPDGKTTKVYASDRPAALTDNREPF